MNVVILKIIKKNINDKYILIFQLGNNYKNKNRKEKIILEKKKGLFK
jgi:hypothetical protein